MSLFLNRPYDIGTLPTTTAHTEPFDCAQDKLRPEGEVEAGVRLDTAPFDFAALRSGRAEKCPTASEEVYECSVVRFREGY